MIGSLTTIQLGTKVKETVTLPTVITAHPQKVGLASVKNSSTRSRNAAAS